MKTNIVLLALLFCATSFAAETNAASMKLGDGIGNHAQNMKAYQMVEQPGGKPIGDLRAEVVMWKVGDGIFSVTHSMGAGRIVEMTYTVPSDADRRIVCKVKEFNPRTGEMTILISSKPSEATSP